MDSMHFSEYTTDSFHELAPSYPDFPADPEIKQDDEEKDNTRVASTYLSGKRTTFLSCEEEQILVMRAREGNESARKQLVESHLPLVIGIARGYSNKGLPLNDLIQEGNIGLIRGVDRFCPDMGTRLSSYATFWIREGMQRSLIRSRIIRLPDYLAKSLHARKQAEERREREARENTPEQKNDVLGGVADIQVFSLDAPQGESNDYSLLDNLVADTLAPENALDEDRARKAIRKCLKSLSSKQREVIVLRFGLLSGEPMTLEEVATEVGTSREAVRQLQVRALRSLRQSLESAGWAGVEG